MRFSPHYLHSLPSQNLEEQLVATIVAIVAEGPARAAILGVAVVVDDVVGVVVIVVSVIT